MQTFNRTLLTLAVLSGPLFGYISFNESEYIGEIKTPAQQQPQVVQTVIEPDFRFQIGGNYTYLTLQPHDHRTFKGSLGGMQALFEYCPLNRFYGAAKLSWRQGNTDSPVGERSILFFDTHERLGYTYAPEKKDWFLTLFSGVGYRYIGQKFSPKTGSSLLFNYDEFYIPIGILTNYNVTSCFSIGLNYTWMPQVYPTVSIIPLKGARWVLQKTMNNFYAEMPFTFYLTQNKRYSLIVTPFYEHWQNGHSTAKLSNGSALGLPANTYNFYGVDVNFGFNF